MSNAIRFLDALGRAPVSVAQAPGFLDMLDELRIEGDQRDALLARDAPALAGLLQARASMICMVATPDGGQEESPAEDAPAPTDEPDGGDGEPGQAPD